MTTKARLGTVRLRDATSNEIILVPTPTSDPNDPLNWSRRYRWYIAILVSAAIFFCNFLAAGPTVVIAQVTMDFFPVTPTDPKFVSDISKTAYFFTTTALMQGMGTLFWMPLIVKYGRRPVYVSSFVLYTGCAVWAGASTTYGSELAARIIMGLASGAAEMLVPLTISDIFFLHERGAIMAIYTCALSAGVSGGIIVSGLISIHLHWRYIYWVSTALIGTCCLLVILTFPETIYRRDEQTRAVLEHAEELDLKSGAERHETTVMNVPQKRGFVQGLSIFSGTYTKENYFKIMLRPVVLLCLPPVLWATLVMSGTIGFLVAISSNFSPAFTTAYNFEPWQSGLCFFAGIIGSFIGIFFGGHFSDFVADLGTKRNGGNREPEMRLPAMAISIVTAPLALVLYGVGINNKLHWMVPTLGLGLINFSIVQATNVSLVYTLDSYRPIAGELVVTQMAFKSAFGFLLSFYTNPWAAEEGYSRAFGAMGGISGALLVLFIPFYFFGRSIRRKTWNWGLIRAFVHWDDDREVGE